jgi:hypothetical protein
MTDDKPFLVAIDEAEAMVRFMEGFAGFTRPPGLDPRDLLDILGKGDSFAFPGGERISTKAPVTPGDLRAIRDGVQRILAYVFEQLAAHAEISVDRVPGAQIPRRQQ